MDGMIVLLLIGWLIKAMSKKGKKAEKRKAAFTSARTAASRLGKSPSQPLPVFEPEQTAFAAEAFASSEGVGTFQEEWRGSMETSSDEGEDLCDPALEHDRPERTDPHSVYANEIGAQHRLDFSPEGLWQGVVMSEILTRPADRQRRKGASWKN